MAETSTQHRWECPFNDALWVEYEIVNGKGCLYLSDKFLDEAEVEWLSLVLSEITLIVSNRETD